MLINSSGNSIYFTVFYSLAFFFAFVMLLWEGYQRKIPIIPWVLLLIFCRVSFIAGTKLFACNREEWLKMINQLTLIPTSDKNLLGGIVFGVIAILTGKYILRIRHNLLDAFAIIVPVSFGIQKIGCFLNGCCYGKPTNLPWGVQYPVNSLPYFSHYESGLISNHDLLSLPVHPVQLYEAAGAFLVAYLVFKSIKYWMASGNLFAFSILLFCFSRFLTEFFRDIQAHTTGGEMIGPFNQIQWFMLFVLLLLSMILYYREKNVGSHVQPNLKPTRIGVKYGLFLFILEAMLILALREWFTQAELLTIVLTFFISGFIIFTWILREIASSRTRMIYAGLLILPLIITSQTIPQTWGDSTQIIRTNRFSFGLTGGSFKNSLTIQTGTSSEGCAQYQTEYFKQKFMIGGAGYSVRDEYPDRKYSTNYGLNLYLGQNREIVQSSGLETKTFLYGVNPYLKIDANWAGIGGGVHVGNLIYPKSSNNADIAADLTTGLNTTTIFPQLYLRFGPQRIIYLDYHLADQFISPFPGFFQEYGIGSGLGQRNGTNIHIGLIYLNQEEGNLFFSGYLLINENISIEPMLAFSSGSGARISFGLHYNLSSKTLYKKNK